MRRPGALAFAVVSAAALAACSSNNSSTANDTGAGPSAPSSHHSRMPHPRHKQSSSPSGSASQTATNLDPCQLVTASEASTLAGTSFGPGREETNPSGSKLCVYGYQTTNVFMVSVAQAANAATGQAAWAQAEARAQKQITSSLPAGLRASLHVQDVSGLADRAATATFSQSIEGRTLSISAIYLLKGSTFLTFSDLVLGRNAPTAAALEQQAQTSLGRV